MITRRNLTVFFAGIVTLMLLTMGASAYVTHNILTEDRTTTQRLSESNVPKHTIKWNEARQEPRPQPQKVASNCDDANIVGTAIGAVAGGVVGNQIGSGKGQDLATIGGALGGGYLGHEYIPTRNTLCR